MSRSLAPFFGPKSIAVVGAAERATSSGGAVLQNLQISGYPGRIVPVNPKGGTMMGTLPHKARWFASLEAASIPAFNDVEAMAECAGLLARCPTLKRAATAPGPNRPPALKGRGG